MSQPEISDETLPSETVGGVSVYRSTFLQWWLIKPLFIKFYSHLMIDKHDQEVGQLMLFWTQKWDTRICLMKQWRV